MESNLQKVRENTKLKHLLLDMAKVYQEELSNVLDHEKKRPPKIDSKWDHHLNRKDDPKYELSKSIICHYCETRPTKYTQKKRKIVLNFILKVIQLIIPEIKLVIYGSVACGLDDNNSDIDVGLIVPGKPLSLKETDIILLKIVDTFQLLKQSGTIVVVPVLRAKVPIVTIEELLSGIQVDMSLRPADLKLKLFKEYIQVDDRVLPFLKILKYWGKQRNICNAYAGFINSFGYCCCGIAYLQNTNPPILPNLQLSEKDILSASDFESFGKNNKMSIGEILCGFFNSMIEFDYETKRISILRGGYAPKDKESFGDEQISDHSFIIEDPFEPNVNFSRHVRKETLQILKEEFLRASQILNNGGSIIN